MIRFTLTILCLFALTQTSIAVEEIYFGSSMYDRIYVEKITSTEAEGYAYIESKQLSQCVVCRNIEEGVWKVICKTTSAKSGE
jgi:hypothetical protein